MNVLMSDADYAPWLMDALKLIEEEKVERLAVVGISAKGEVMTGYYNMEMSDKALVIITWKCPIKLLFLLIFRLTLYWILFVPTKS